jgi:beta-galactosidase/beta-glucuronidase
MDVVWHALAPFSAYGHETYRFVSEFGFESLPAIATVAAFAPDPADWNLGSPMLDHHQRCAAGNARILYYLAQQFRLPRDFDGLVYLSQILQAEAMRVGVEHWRRERSAAAAPCTGSSTIAGRFRPGPASTTSAAGRRSTTPRGGSTPRCSCPVR